MASQLPYQLRPSARNQTSISATAANSQNHSITALAPIESKATTARPDLTLYRFAMEFRAAECGKEDDVGIGKKKIVESNLHCPKILKAVLVFIGKKCDNNLMVLQSSKIIGFTQFHLRMRMHLLNIPNGFVCGIQLTEQYEVPTTPSLMSAENGPELDQGCKAIPNGGCYSGCYVKFSSFSNTQLSQRVIQQPPLRRVSSGYVKSKVEEDPDLISCKDYENITRTPSATTGL
ncbi:hypothetical protein BDC45DRAFT_574951 [Circinella umbellata]|nr:hypothetical protein BDC45DRAFT_574951 [Circinella umbellata]